jgi:hypothetical protein
MANKWIDAEIEDLKQKRREEFQTKTLGQQQAFTAGQQEKLFAQQEKQGHVKFGRDVAMQEAKGRQARELAKLKPTTAKMDAQTAARLKAFEADIKRHSDIINSDMATPEQKADALNSMATAIEQRNSILGIRGSAPLSSLQQAAPGGGVEAAPGGGGEAASTFTPPPVSRSDYFKAQPESRYPVQEGPLRPGEEGQYGPTGAQQEAQQQAAMAGRTSPIAPQRQEGGLLGGFGAELVGGAQGMQVNAARSQLRSIMEMLEKGVGSKENMLKRLERIMQVLPEDEYAEVLARVEAM